MAKPGRRVRFDPDSAMPLAIANELDSLLSPPPSRRWNPSAIRSPLVEVEDRRTFHPLLDQRPVRSLRKWAVRLVAKPPKGRAAAKLTARPNVFRFSFGRQPEHVAICIRRSQRKEVLHALKKTGKGSGRSHRRRGQYSDVRC